MQKILIKFILFSIQVYWSSLCIPLSKIHKDNNDSLKTFLWSGVELTKTKTKVAQREVCVPKEEEDLDIRRTKSWNKATMIRHLCNHSQVKSNFIRAAWVKNEPSQEQMFMGGQYSSKLLLGMEESIKVKK